MSVLTVRFHSCEDDSDLIHRGKFCIIMKWWISLCCWVAFHAGCRPVKGDLTGHLCKQLIAPIVTSYTFLHSPRVGTNLLSCTVGNLKNQLNENVILFWSWSTWIHDTPHLLEKSNLEGWSSQAALESSRTLHWICTGVGIFVPLGTFASTFSIWIAVSHLQDECFYFFQKDEMRH